MLTAAKQENHFQPPIGAFGANGFVISSNGLPKTRVRGLDFENQAFVGASLRLSSTSRRACGYRCDGTPSGSPDQRFYASTYGRFNTVDPLASSAMTNHPGTWNRYSYALGDPVNANDPHGACTYWQNESWDDLDQTIEFMDADSGAVAGPSGPCPDDGGSGGIDSGVTFSVDVTATAIEDPSIDNLEDDWSYPIPYPTPDPAMLSTMSISPAGAEAFLCGSNSTAPVWRAMRSGLVIGVTRGGYWGFVGSETFLGIETAGVSGIGGAILGGIVGGVIGAAGGAFKGVATSLACGALGAYVPNGGSGSGGGPLRPRSPFPLSPQQQLPPRLGPMR